jgi:hypothetical protein
MGSRTLVRANFDLADSIRDGFARDHILLPLRVEMLPSN